MEYGNIIRKLLTDVPQIRPYYEEEIEWLEEDLPHVIFGMVLTPYIIKSLEEHRNVETIFNFLEEMALSVDEKVQELLVVSVLESLITERGIIEIAKSHMGERTRQLFKTAEQAYGF
ncbi:hypothetical protein ABE237_16190 [Brevibacillus formosus]|uniref:DUF7674 family protein n=1 Tax=Brevibacillus formosus TaxID=54913 RepID=UPI0018CFBD60|nr:hypothetical protein [Brevibacillus formosus]MBG9944241.1 hypothetical protein [Brevibacillus formosus]